MVVMLNKYYIQSLHLPPVSFHVEYKNPEKSTFLQLRSNQPKSKEKQNYGYTQRYLLCQLERRTHYKDSENFDLSQCATFLNTINKIVSNILQQISSSLDLVKREEQTGLCPERSCLDLSVEFQSPLYLFFCFNLLGCQVQSDSQWFLCM